VICGLCARGVSVSALGCQQASPAQATTQETLERVRADLFARAEHLDEDVRELKQILAIDPRSAEAHVLLGIAYRTQGSQELIGESVAEFRQALEIDPGLVPVRLYLARVYLDLGRALRAREELEHALEQAPGNAELLALQGETERQLKNPQRAVELTRQALQADESNAQPRYYLALALYDLGRRDEAIRELEKVAQSGPPVADPYLALGTAYLDAGRTPDALRTLGQGIRIDPNRPELHIQMARAYRMSGSLDKAEAQLTLADPKRTAATPMSDYQRQQVDVDLYLEHGLLDLRRGQLTAAGEAFKKVLAMDPNNDQATRGLAEVTRRKKAGGRT
jgi:tetratricopeptide (TPR) repeat protein